MVSCDGLRVTSRVYSCHRSGVPGTVSVSFNTRIKCLVKIYGTLNILFFLGAIILLLLEWFKWMVCGLSNCFKCKIWFFNVIVPPRPVWVPIILQLTAKIVLFCFFSALWKNGTSPPWSEWWRYPRMAMYPHWIMTPRIFSLHLRALTLSVIRETLLSPWREVGLPHHLSSWGQLQRLHLSQPLG